MTPVKSSTVPGNTAPGNTFLEELVQDIIRGYEEEQALGAGSCRECQKSAAPRYDCPVCGPKEYCDRHITKHVARRHSQDPVYERVRNLKVRQYMLKGSLSAFYTPEKVVTLGGEADNQARSNWYGEARHLGLEHPCIITWRPPEPGEAGDREKSERGFIREVNEFLEVLDLRAYNWTAAKNFTLFAAGCTGAEYLPQNTGNREQDSLSGLVFNPDAKPGKTMKRLRARTQAEGAWFVPEPSWFPEIRLPGGVTHRVTVEDSKTAGDGSGAYRKSAAEELVRASGASWTKDIIAVQMSFLGADYAAKGMFLVVDDHEFPGPPDADLVIDRESVNRDVLSTRFTKGKATPIRHKPNTRQVYVEPLILGEVVSRFIDPAELASQALILADSADKETWRHATAGGQEDRFTGESAGPAPADSKRPHLEQAVSRRSAEDRTLAAYLASGSSPFASPQVMDRLAGGTAKHWESRAKRSAPMPGIMASGEAVWLMHPGYAQSPAPGPKYAGLVWDREDPDQLTGVSLNRSDLFKHRDALDTVDCDDKLTLVFLRDGGGQPHVLVLRLPLSIDGGICLKLKRQDARKLEQLGYHFYRKEGDHQWPGLYTLIKGKPVFPYRLEAQPFETKPAWTTREEDALASLLELTRYRAVIGQVTNLSANLDYAGLYDPGEHKFNLSDSIIDPSLNASADPSPVIRPLEERLLQAVQEGKRMDPCVFDRVKGRIEKLHRETAPEAGALEVRLECRPRHHRMKAGMSRATQLLSERLRRRKLLANGPAEWLTASFSPELTAIAADAFSRRYAAWSECGKKRHRIRKDETLDRRQREARTAQLIEEAKQAEAEIISLAYAEAFFNAPGYQRGQFMALWVQLCLGQAKRFQSALEPISTHSLDVLPLEEHQGYYAGGTAVGAAVVRTTNGAGPEPGQPCRVRETLRPGSKGQPKVCCQLVTPEGEVIATLEKEARSYAGHNLTVLGWLPRIGPTGHWLQGANLLALQAEVPAASSGPEQ